MRRQILCIAIVVITTVLIGCGDRREPLPSLDESVGQPYQEFDNPVMHLYSGTAVLWTLRATYMRKILSDTARMLVVPVHLTLFDTTEVQAGAERSHTTVLGDSGYTTSARDSFFVWGNVQVNRRDGLKIRSGSLWWNQARHRVGSEDFVEIRTAAGDVVRGKGLDATETFSRWSIKKNVSGEFPNFRDRADSDDGF